jgi:hypothetical protein
MVSRPLRFDQDKHRLTDERRWNKSNDENGHRNTQKHADQKNIRVISRDSVADFD